MEQIIIKYSYFYFFRYKNKGNNIINDLQIHNLPISLSDLHKLQKMIIVENY